MLDKSDVLYVGEALVAGTGLQKWNTAEKNHVPFSIVAHLRDAVLFGLLTQGVAAILTGVSALLSGQVCMTRSRKKTPRLCLQNCCGLPQYTYYVSLVPVLFSHLSYLCYDRNRFSWLSIPSFYTGRIYLPWIFSLWAIQFTLGKLRGCYRAWHRQVGSMCNGPQLFGGRTTAWRLQAGKKGKQLRALKHEDYQWWDPHAS